MPDSRVDQIVGEAFSKTASVVLGARVTSSSAGERPPAVRRTPNKWFNLDAQELECVAEDFAPWRRGSTQAPLIIQIVLKPREQPATAGDSQSETKQPEALQSCVLEEWVLEFQPREAAATSGHPDQTQAAAMMSRRQQANLDTHAIYKRLVIFHRSLYSYVRVLPAFKIFKGLKRHPSLPYEIVARTLPAQSLAPAKDNASFRFAPVDTPKASFQASVTYSTSNPIPKLEQLQQVQVPQRARIIQDYIRTPPGPPAPAPRDQQQQPFGSAPATAGPVFRRVFSLPQERQLLVANSSEMEMVGGRQHSMVPSRQSWASNPVTVSAPKGWASSPPDRIKAQPSLLPKATPWPTTLPSGVQPIPSASPRSTLSQPASLPSSSGNSVPSSLPSGPITQSMSNTSTEAPVGFRPGANTQSSLVVPDQQAGFQLADGSPSGTLGVGPSTQVQAKGVRLAKGGITAAAAAGQMAPQGTGVGEFYPRTKKSPRKGCGGEVGAESCGRGSGGGLGEEGPGLQGGVRTHSSPMCIPRAAMPRNSSSTQLAQRRSRNPRDSHGHNAGEARVPRRPILSAPEAQPFLFEYGRGPGDGVESADSSPNAPIRPSEAVEGPQGHGGPPSIPPCPQAEPAEVRLGEVTIMQTGRTTSDGGTSCESGSPFPMSCSPQLPFAFTPASASNSLLHKAGAALMEAHTLGRQARGVSPGMPGAFVPTAGPVSSGGGAVLGRDVSNLALIRRSSWSTKSFSQDTHLQWLGSFSPSANLMGTSQGSSLGTAQGGTAIVCFPSGFSPASDGLPSLECNPFALAAAAEVQDDDDTLPFALEDCTDDWGGGLDAEPPTSWLDGTGEASETGSSIGQCLSASVTSDAAVGALARMFQEAPALCSGSTKEATGPELGAVLGDIEGLRRHLATLQAGGAAH